MSHHVLPGAWRGHFPAVNEDQAFFVRDLTVLSGLESPVYSGGAILGCPRIFSITFFCPKTSWETIPLQSFRGVSRP